jgi:tripartite ATP-independent transporter DctP family solute receptor
LINGRPYSSDKASGIAIRVRQLEGTYEAYRRAKGLKVVMPTSKETGHGGAGSVTIFGKKLRKQRPWKVENWLYREFVVLQMQIIESEWKMMLKKLRCLVLAMALVLVLVSCSTFAANKSIKLVYGHVFPADHYFSKCDYHFKELVEKKSKGQIIIDFFPASQIGSSTEMLQAVKSGAQQIYFGGLPTVFLPKLLTFPLPYLYRDEAHQLKVMSKLSSLVDPNELAAKAGVRIIGARATSARHLTTKFPVNKIEDIKGLKVRVPENPMFLAFWKTVGAVPTVIPTADVYTALATGTVDAQENPFSDIYANKFFEQVKYCALTAHIRSIYTMVINNNCWNGLTTSQQKIIIDAADKSCKMSESLRRKNEAEYKKMLAKEGMKFTQPALAPFREKAKAVWSQFGDAELLKKIEAIK